MAKKYTKSNYRSYKRVKNYVPGWGGTLGRMGKIAQGYTSKGGVAYKALGLARKLADAVNTEYKNVAQIVTTAAPDWNGIVTILNETPQGDDGYQHIGDSIKCQHLRIPGYIQRNTIDGLVRIMLIWDDQNIITSLSDLLQVTGSLQVVNSVKNYQNRFACSVMYDHTFSVTADSPIKRFKIDMPINKHTNYNVGSNVVRTGALKLFYMSTDASGNQPLVNFYSNLTYTDN